MCGDAKHPHPPHGDAVAYTEFGQKGVGEGGAIGPAAAIANAVNDAMRTLGVELCEIPISPRILKALSEAKAASAGVDAK
jgi:aerobic carbon-monoxide dehydrogenase large subunit